MAANFLSEAVRWRHLNFDSLAAVGYPLLLLGALLLPDWRLQAAALGSVAAGALVAWLRGYRRYRCIVDTPTSRLRSAAQGYVELSGRADLFGPDDSIGFAWTPPAVWLRYAVYRRTHERLSVIERGQSASVFVLDDGSARCLVDPEGAEVYTTRRFREERGDYLYRGEYIAPGDTLHVLGRLQTVGGRVGGDTDGDVGALVSTWKRDRGFLLSHFDRNRDGEIDMQEWQAVRAAATANIRARERDAAYDPVTHRIGTAGGWRPYLVSAIDEPRIARRYRNWAALHLLLLLLAGALCASLLLHPPPAAVHTVVRAAMLSIPAGFALRLGDREFAAAPTAPGGSALHRTTLPVGPARIRLVYPDGSTYTDRIEIPAGNKLLVIAVTGNRQAPLTVY